MQALHIKVGNLVMGKQSADQKALPYQPKHTHIQDVRMQIKHLIFASPTLEVRSRTIQ